MKTIHALFEDGVFKPTEPIDLPEACEVVFSPQIVERPDADDEWTEAKNARRCELIDRRIQGTITSAEERELDRLQRQAIAERDRKAPLPIDGARRLHEQLMAVKRKHDEASS